MNSPSRRIADSALAALRSARFARAVTLCAVGTAFLAFALRSTIGWPGLLGILGTLVLIAAASITVNRRELEWHGLLPISLLVFVGWSALSVLWSDYQWVTLGAVAYQVAFAFLGVYIALTRDLIQIVRAFGDVLRVILAVSLLLEIMSGIILDTPFGFLSISGTLAFGGPIEGLLGTRNQLGLVALIALVTFFVETQTRSIGRSMGFASIALATAMMLFSRSPVILGTVVIVALAALALIGLRRLEPTARRAWQFVLLGVSALTLLILFATRSRVIDLLNAGSEFEFRYSLWRDILEVSSERTLEGFGWVGYWRPDIPPFIGIDPFAAPHETALNAFVDVLLQLGIVGLFSFLALVGLAFVRSWLLAATKRSFVFVWPALMLVALIIVSAAESSILVEFGWFTLVICALKASQNLSWRERLPLPQG